MTEIHTGDIYAHTWQGHPRYIRVLAFEQAQPARPAVVVVHDCDAAGFHLDNRSRILQAATLTSRYRLHHRHERTSA